MWSAVRDLADALTASQMHKSHFLSMENVLVLKGDWLFSLVADFVFVLLGDQKMFFLLISFLLPSNVLISSIINSSTSKPLSAASIKDTKAEASRNIWAMSHSKVVLPWRQHSKNRKHPSSVVGWPLWTENWKLCHTRDARSLLRASEKNQQNVIRTDRFWQSCHPDTFLLHARSPGQQEVSDFPDPQPQQWRARTQSKLTGTWERRRPTRMSAAWETAAPLGVGLAVPPELLWQHAPF